MAAMTFYICDEAGITIRQASSMLQVGDIVTVNGRDRIVTGETGTAYVRYYYTRIC